MRFAHAVSSFIVLLLCGLCLQASAASILDDPVCVKALAPEEFSSLKACLERGALCSKYWPTQAEDLQKCEATTSWIRATKAWPLAQQQEVFGADGLSKPAEVLPPPEPAWKKLPRSGIPSTTAQLNIPGNAGTNAYAGTSAAITPQAAESVGWNVSALTGAIKMAGQMAQDRTAMQSPEAAAQAKEVLGSVGLGEYAASDEAIERGRQVLSGGRGQQPSSGFFPNDIEYVNGPGLQVNENYKPMGCVVWVQRPDYKKEAYDLKNNCRYKVDVYFGPQGPYSPDKDYSGPSYSTLYPGKMRGLAYGPNARGAVLACLEVDSLLRRRKGELEGVPDYDGYICKKHHSTNGGSTGTAL